MSDPESYLSGQATADAMKNLKLVLQNFLSNYLNFVTHYLVFVICLRKTFLALYQYFKITNYDNKRKLGNNGPEVSAIGTGCMGMCFGYGPSADKKEMIALIHIHKTAEEGVRFSIQLKCMHKIIHNA